MEALKREPLAVRTAIGVFVAAVIHLVVLFGVNLDPGAEGTIVTAVDAAVALFIILTVRPKVTPVEAPVLTADQVATGTIYGTEDADWKVVPRASANTVIAEGGEPADRVPGADHRA